MVFVEELLYFIGFRVLKDDFGMRVIGVLIDKDGMMVDEFENLIIEYLNKLRFVIDKKLYFLMLYCVFIFNNLIGFCFVLERCEKLIKVFRKYDVFVICDDVYNLLSFVDDAFVS